VTFGTGGCTTPIAVTPGCQKNLTYDSAQVQPPSSSTCSAFGSPSGSTSTAGFERTVCCNR
jgi:hypothetical protein